MATLTTTLDQLQPPPLPIYSPSLPAPEYSYEPSSGEQRLDHTPNARRRIPTGTFVRKQGKVTIVLNDQEDNVQIPVYGRHGLISGTILIEEYLSIAEVTLKVEGKLEATSSEVAPQSLRMFSDSHTIWTNRPGTTPSCPDHVPFIIPFPSTFQYNDSLQSLPPTFEGDFSGVRALYIHIAYAVTIVISGIQRRKGGLWASKTKRVYIPFKYLPRTRSHRPIIRTPTFFSAIKSTPEEWYQTGGVMNARPNSKTTPIEAHLFLPSGRVYSLEDTIPFHIQLTGAVSSLRELLGTCTSPSSPSSLPSQLAPRLRCALRVYLLRQVCLESRGRRSWRNITMGEGEVHPVPPLLADRYGCPMTNCHGNEINALSESRVENLDWEGELKVKNGQAETASFSTGPIAVKDFIMLTLTPTRPVQSPLLELQLPVSIRLVTDSWMDIANPEERLL
ncbi:hypothetical protein BDN72DRAFT_818177 [Pluteus cervinus]|uniref:Uncharacterized protein n=1 Tax=Pluteus cervinus TaxID=181527 RepID=A0ACD3AZ81_9AGAR|nr:hypothetical protein BDN72DRAFT_818177 [Pluteus cervinus]